MWGCHIAWATGDPVGADGWEAPQFALMQGLLPNIRQFVRVRQALVSASVLGMSVTDLLDLLSRLADGRTRLHEK